MKKYFLFLLLFATVIIDCKSEPGVTDYSLTSTTLSPRNTLKIDAAGNKWIAFWFSGLGKFDGTTWIMYDTLTSSIPSNTVNDIGFDPSNNVWVATIKGLAKFDGTTWTTYNVMNSGLPNDSVLCVFTDGSNIWAGTNNGLAKYDGSTWTIYNTTNSGLTTNMIQCVSVSSIGEVLVGTKFGLYKKSGSTWSNYNSTNPYMVNTYSITHIYIDSSDGVWAGVNGNLGAGIYKLIDNTLIPLYQLFPLNHYIYYPLPISWLSISKGPMGGAMFFIQGELTEIVGAQMYRYSGIGLSYNIFDSASGLIWCLTRSAAPSSLNFYSYNYLSYPSSALVNYVPPTSENLLDINLMRQKIAHQSQLQQCEVPKNSERYSIFASSISIGGKDINDSLHFAQVPYNSSASDGFWPGPLDTISGTIDSVTSANYYKIWKIDRAKIEEFKNMFASGDVASGAYIVDDDIVTWPAVGTGNISRKLAPFVDVNHDGIYNPLVDGDYPDIKGDQMCYWIFNDKLKPHPSSGASFKIEIHASAYEYVCPTITDSLKVLNYTTFYNYQIFNRSTENYHDTYLGIFQDDDLGSASDDFVGCTPSLNYGSTFNGDMVDDNPPAGQNAYGIKPPMLSTVILNGPLAEPSDGIDNNNNGVVDESGEKNLMTHFLYYNNDGTPTGNPSTPAEMYNYMKSIWKDSTHVTYGGLGHLGVTPTNFMFDGTPADSSGWCEEAIGDVPADRRFLMSCGPFNLNAGENVSFDYAIVYTRDTADVYTIQNLYQKNKQDVKQIQQWFAVDSFPSCLDLSFETPILVKSNNGTLGVYPNPSSDNITIDYSSTSKNYNLKIYSSTGVLIKKIDETTTTSISIADFKNGLYLLNLQDGNNSVTKRFIKQSH
jgi:hypothetical protein